MLPWSSGRNMQWLINLICFISLYKYYLIPPTPFFPDKLLDVCCTPDVCDHQALWREQMANDNNGLLLHEIDAGQCPERRGISDSDPTYKSHWFQWKSLAVRASMLEQHCQSTDGKKKTAQIVTFRSKLRKVVAQMHRGPFGVNLGVNKTNSQAALLLAAFEGRCGEVVSSVWLLCNQPRAQNHKSGHWSILQEDLHWLRWTLPREWQGNQLPPGHHGLHQVARNLRRPQPRCIESGRHPGDQLVQLEMTRDLQWQKPKLRNQANVGGPGVTGVSEIRTPLHLQLDGKVKHYTKANEEYLRNMVSRYQHDWEDRLHIFQLAYWDSTNETTSMTPANMVFGWALYLPCDLQTC